MALPNNNITAGAPPLLWSNMKDALDKINDNFIALDLATGGTAVDLSVLNTDVSPEYTDTYTLGTVTNQWKRVHSAAWTDTLAGSLNGLWAGQAQIKGYEKEVDTGFGGPLPRWIIDLPVGSTVDGQLIIDPSKTFIKTIQVDGNKSLESTVYGFTANFTSGLGIGLTVTSASDEIEFAVDPTFDLNGSILADDTSVLVDRAGYIRGNVNTTSDWTATVNGNVWTFKDTGLLQFPGDSVFGYVTGEGDKLSSGSTSDLVLSSNQSIKVITDADAGVVTWSFNESGEFVVPGPISFEYSGTPIIGISTTTTSGRIIGETNKSFSIVLTDGTNPKDWTLNTNGSIVFPELTELGSIGGTGTFGFSTIANSDFLIETDNGTSSTWTFGANGVTTFGTNQTVEADGFHGDLYGDVYGNLTGGVTGNVFGNVTGNVTGNTSGYHTGDVKGSVMADDSTLLVDGVDAKIVGPVYTSTLRTSEIDIIIGSEAATNWTGGEGSVAIGVQAGFSQDGSQTGRKTTAVGGFAGWDQKDKATAIGNQAGTDHQGEETVAVGFNAGAGFQGDLAVAVGGGSGYLNQGAGAVAVGHQAAMNNQGAAAIAIGKFAAHDNQHANSIVINATGAVLDSTAASALYVAPIRNAAGTNGILQYNSSTKEVSYSSALGAVSGTFTGNIFTTLIDSADSSAITVTPATVFSSDVSVENELFVQGSKVINLSTIKTIVAASATFADFKAAIAAL